MNTKSEFTHEHIKNLVKSYRTSLDYLREQILDEKIYLDNSKILQLLKVIYTTDECLKLLSLGWHPINDKNQSFTALGIETEDNELIVTKLKQDPEQILMYRQLNKATLSEISLAIVVPVFEHHYHNKIKTVNLLGYLKLEVEAATLLHDLYNYLEDYDLIKIHNRKNNKITYFSKQHDLFRPINNFNFFNIKTFLFSENVSFGTYGYSISIGQDAHILINKFLYESLIRNIIIIIFGSVIMICYKLFNEKKTKSSYSNASEYGGYIKQAYLKLSATKHSESAKKLYTMEKIENWIRSTKEIIHLEQRVNKFRNSTLLKIKYYNHLLVQHYKNKKKLSNKSFKQTFENINNLTTDLLYNIACKESGITEVDLDPLIIKTLTILAPILDEKEITIVNLANITSSDKSDTSQLCDIKTIQSNKIKINELMLEQILLNILVRVLCFAENGKNINISVQKNIKINSITIELNYQGCALNENMFQDFLYMQGNGSLLRLSHLILHLETVKRLVKEEVEGEFKTTTLKLRNKVTILLPLNPRRFGVIDSTIPIEENNIHNEH